MQFSPHLIGPNRAPGVFLRRETLLLLAVVLGFHAVRPLGAQADEGESCAKHEVLYERIHKDLARFTQGITPEIWDKHLNPGCAPNTACSYVSLIVVNGDAYLTTLPDRHPENLGVVSMYSWFLLEIYEAIYKYNIPDVEFAITHFDDPPDAYPGAHQPHQAPVILSLAKSEEMTSILMPFSAHFRCYPNPFDLLLPNLTEIDQYKWSTKKETAVGRYSNFCAWWHEGAKFQNGKQVECARRYLTRLSKKHEDLVDCKFAGAHQERLYIPLYQQAAYKYVVSTDGWTASSKLAKYLLLNSTILKQHSPKKEYYYDAIKPMEHYVPFYVNHSDDIVEQVRWLRSHDADAQRIAAAGRAFATTHLTRPARLCYWRQLLIEISKRQTFKPSCERRRICVPLLKELSYLGHFITRELGGSCDVHGQLDEIHGTKLDHGKRLGKRWGDVMYVHDTPL